MGDQIGRGGILSGTLSHWRITMARRFLSGRILDFGCGRANLAPFVAPHLYFGVDNDAESLSIARNLYPSHQFGERIPANLKFNTIVALAVIEHVVEPRLLLNIFKAALSENGRIVLSTPCPYSNSVHRIGAEIGIFSKEAHEQHSQLLDKYYLCNLATSAGLQVAYFRYFMLGMNQLIVLKCA